MLFDDEIAGYKELLSPPELITSDTVSEYIKASRSHLNMEPFKNGNRNTLKLLQDVSYYNRIHSYILKS